MNAHFSHFLSFCMVICVERYNSKLQKYFHINAATLWPFSKQGLPVLCGSQSPSNKVLSWALFMKQNLRFGHIWPVFGSVLIDTFVVFSLDYQKRQTLFCFIIFQLFLNCNSIPVLMCWLYIVQLEMAQHRTYIYAITLTLVAPLGP